MQIDNFIELVKQGFDVSFNYKDVFYTISLLKEKDGIKKYGIGSDTGFTADFDSVDTISEFVLDDKTIGEIVTELNEEEIFY